MDNFDNAANSSSCGLYFYLPAAYNFQAENIGEDED